MHAIDAREFRLLETEFEKMRPQLLQIGRRVDAEGAWARAMLLFGPAFLLHINRERGVAIPPRDAFEGMLNMFCDIIRHTIRATNAPSERLNALDVALRHFERVIRPKLLIKNNVVLPSDFLQ